MFCTTKKGLIILGVHLLSAPSAYGHVVFNEIEAKAGEFQTAQMRITHGCSGNPTTSITVTIPDGVTRVTPRAMTGWTVEVGKRKLDKPVMLHGFEVDETVKSLTWSGGSFPDHTYEQFEFRMMVPNLEGAILRFPVHQKCTEGEITWDQVPKANQNPYELDEPAPFIKIIP